MFLFWVNMVNVFMKNELSHEKWDFMEILNITYMYQCWLTA